MSNKLQRKIEDLLYLKFDEGKNEEKVLTMLSKTKWLNKYKADEIDHRLLEKCYRKVADKYAVRIGYIMESGDSSWAFMLKNDETHQWIHTVYARTMFEGAAKALIVFYAHCEMDVDFKEGGD